MNDEWALPGQSIVPIVLAFLILLGLGVLLRAWSRSLAARAPRWHWLTRLPVVGLILIVLGMIGTIAGLVHSFSAVEHTPPEQRAQVLASGIAMSMWSTALVAAPGLVLYLVTGVICVALSLRRTFDRPTDS